MPHLLDDPTLDAALADLPGWSRAGRAITRTFEFATFPDAIAFVTRVAFPAERMDHHPDLDVRYTKVVVTLATHSMGGVTDLDLELARVLQRLATG